jgi:hypothetical protein
MIPSRLIAPQVIYIVEESRLGHTLFPSIVMLPNEVRPIFTGSSPRSIEPRNLKETDSRDRKRVPFSSEYRRFRSVNTHRQRAIRVVIEWHPEESDEGFVTVLRPKINSQERQQDAHHDSRRRKGTEYASVMRSVIPFDHLSHPLQTLGLLALNRGGGENAHARKKGLVLPCEFYLGYFVQTSFS